MSAPDITDEEIAAVADVVRSGRLSQGPQLQEFEEAFARYVGSNFAIGVSSGTSGLHMCIASAGCDENSLVVTTPFSFIASANAILYERAIPVFVDVDPVTGNLDPDRAAETIDDLVGSRSQRHLPRSLREADPSIRDKLQPAAFLPVHIFGQPADLETPLTLARANGLTVIEDACEAIGAAYKGRAVGTFGEMGVFGFYPNKQMTTAEGGMIVTDDPDKARYLRSIRNQGRSDSAVWLEHERLGFNYRLDEVRAALGRVQLGRIDELIAKRAEVARLYDERLRDVPCVTIPVIAATTTKMSWFIYVIRLDDGIDRTKLMRILGEKGIPTRPYFSTIHLQPFYRERFAYQPGDFPVAEHLAQSCLALPFSGGITEETVDVVTERLVAALRET